MGWTDRCKQLPLGICSLLPGKGGLCWEQTKSPFQIGFLFLIPTNTAGPLLIEMVATATVGHVLLACVGALRVDACLPHRAWGTDTQTLIDIYRGKDGDNGVKPGGLPKTQPLDLQRNPISLLFKNHECSYDDALALDHTAASQLAPRFQQHTTP